MIQRETVSSSLSIKMHISQCFTEKPTACGRLLTHWNSHLGACHCLCNFTQCDQDREEQEQCRRVQKGPHPKGHSEEVEKERRWGHFTEGAMSMFEWERGFEIAKRGRHKKSSPQTAADVMAPETAENHRPWTWRET